MRKTKSELEQEIKDLQAQLKKTIRSKQNPANPITINGCTLTGVKWDAKAVETVQTVADGLLNLTKLFQSQNIQIRALMEISDTTKVEG